MPVASSTPQIHAPTLCEPYRKQIEAFTDWKTQDALNVCQAESKGRNIKNPEPHRNRAGTVLCYGSHGPMQVGCIHYKNGEDTTNVELNFEKAHAIWKQSGWKPWSVSKGLGL